MSSCGGRDIADRQLQHELPIEHGARKIRTACGVDAVEQRAVFAIRAAVGETDQRKRRRRGEFEIGTVTIPSSHPLPNHASTTARSIASDRYPYRDGSPIGSDDARIKYATPAWILCSDRVRGPGLGSNASSPALRRSSPRVRSGFAKQSER